MRTCKVEGCAHKHKAKGYCDIHYSRSRRGGDVTVDLRKPASPGNILRRPDGYVWEMVAADDPYVSMVPGSMVLSNGSGRVHQHRLVMARNLGRPLESSETVHHINGDKADNRIENLQLRTSHHGPGVAAECRNCGSYDVKFIELVEAC